MFPFFWNKISSFLCFFPKRRRVPVEIPTKFVKIYKGTIVMEGKAVMMNEGNFCGHAYWGVTVFRFSVINSLIVAC